MHSRRALSMVCPSQEGSNPLGLTFGGMVHPQTNSTFKTNIKRHISLQKVCEKVYRMQVSYHRINHMSNVLVNGKWVQKSFDLSFIIIKHSFISVSDNLRSKSRVGENGTKFQLLFLVGRSCPSTHFSYDLVSRRMSQLCCRVTMQF